MLLSLLLSRKLWGTVTEVSKSALDGQGATQRAGEMVTALKALEESILTGSLAEWTLGSDSVCDVIKILQESDLTTEQQDVLTALSDVKASIMQQSPDPKATVEKLSAFLKLQWTGEPPSVELMGEDGSSNESNRKLFFDCANAGWKLFEFESSTASSQTSFDTFLNCPNSSLERLITLCA